MLALLSPLASSQLFLYLENSPLPAFSKARHYFRCIQSLARASPDWQPWFKHFTPYGATKLLVVIYNPTPLFSPSLAHTGQQPGLVINPSCRSFFFSAQWEKADHSPSETSEKLRVCPHYTEERKDLHAPIAIISLSVSCHFHPYALSADTTRHYFLSLVG